jgi:hypothetical protein
MHEPGSHLSYRPLTTISFRFNHYFHELRPFGYHVVNIALHAAVTVLFAVAARRMLCSTPTAVFAGILFAVHPLHVEVATNIIGRAESLAGTQAPTTPFHLSPASYPLQRTLLSTPYPLSYAVPHPATAIFFLVALLLFLPVAAAPRPGWARLFAAWACISIGVFCKEQCVTVVGVCAVWEVVRLLQEWRRDEEAAAAQDNPAAAAAAVSSETHRMRRLVTCALLRWSCFTLLTLSLLFFRLRFNDHKPARCCNFDHLSSCYIYILDMRWNISDLIAILRTSHATAQLCPRGKSCSSGR